MKGMTYPLDEEPSHTNDISLSFLQRDIWFYTNSAMDLGKENKDSWMLALNWH